MTALDPRPTAAPTGGGSPVAALTATGSLLTALRAAGESTRLRLLALTADAELTVSELTQILGQSQPRVSRHLKLLCDAGLLERFPEGISVFYRLARTGPAAHIGRTLVGLVGAEGEIANDHARLEAIKSARAEAAAAYFRANAVEWDRIRGLHVPEGEVEAAIRRLLSERTIGDFLDIGTGTGRILEALGRDARRGTGIDLSREMLALARARLEGTGLDHCEVRLADMYSLPFPEGSIDTITCHQVLHFAADPAAAVAEAARVLRPAGLLILADFAPHTLEDLRDHHAHRRLGFSDDEVAGWFRSAHLVPGRTVALDGDPLTVVIWSAVASGGAEAPA